MHICRIDHIKIFYLWFLLIIENRISIKLSENTKNYKYAYPGSNKLYMGPVKFFFFFLIPMQIQTFVKIKMLKYIYISKEAAR